MRPYRMSSPPPAVPWTTRARERLAEATTEHSLLRRLAFVVTLPVSPVVVLLVCWVTHDTNKPPVETFVQGAVFLLGGATFFLWAAACALAPAFAVGYVKDHDGVAWEALALNFMFLLVPVLFVAVPLWGIQLGFKWVIYGNTRGPR